MGGFILDKDLLPKGVKMEHVEKMYIFTKVPNVETSVSNNMG
jgi:hypothetical protein